MLSDLFDVLTCSNLTCPNPPPWYELGENFFAHLGMGAGLGWLVQGRWAWPIFAAFVFKEAALDIPRDAVLSVMTDSALDLFAIAVGLWVLPRPLQSKDPAPIKPLTRL